MFALLSSVKVGAIFLFVWSGEVSALTRSPADYVALPVSRA